MGPGWGGRAYFNPSPDDFHGARLAIVTRLAVLALLGLPRLLFTMQYPLSWDESMTPMRRATRCLSL